MKRTQENKELRYTFAFLHRASPDTTPPRHPSASRSTRTHTARSHPHSDASLHRYRPGLATSALRFVPHAVLDSDGTSSIDHESSGRLRSKSPPILLASLPTPSPTRAHACTCARQRVRLGLGLGLRLRAHACVRHMKSLRAHCTHLAPLRVPARRPTMPTSRRLGVSASRINGSTDGLIGARP